MDVIEVGKLLVAVVSALGTIAVTSYNVGQSRKIRTELLEKLEQSLERQNKHSVCEIFRLLYGLRMNYQDIRNLTEDDRVSHILYALRKTPGMVKYENGSFRYTMLFANRWVRLIDKISGKLIASFLGFILMGSVLLMVLSTGVTSLVAFVLILFFAVIFTLQIKQLKYDRMIEDMVKR